MARSPGRPATQASTANPSQRASPSPVGRADAAFRVSGPATGSAPRPTPRISPEPIRAPRAPRGTPARCRRRELTSGGPWVGPPFRSPRRRDRSAPRRAHHTRREPPGARTAAPGPGSRRRGRPPGCLTVRQPPTPEPLTARRVRDIAGIAGNAGFSGCWATSSTCSSPNRGNAAARAPRAAWAADPPPSAGPRRRGNTPGRGGFQSKGGFSPTRRRGGVGRPVPGGSGRWRC